MRPGDIVEYRTVKTDRQPQCTGVVEEYREQGIPSCPMPMIKIEGKPGYVLASHCRVVASKDGP